MTRILSDPTVSQPQERKKSDCQCISHCLLAPLRSTLSLSPTPGGTETDGANSLSACAVRGRFWKRSVNNPRLASGNRSETGETLVPDCVSVYSTSTKTKDEMQGAMVNGEDTIVESTPYRTDEPS